MRYTDQLRRYHEAFTPEQTLVLIYDDFREDNAGTLERVERFLEAMRPHGIVELARSGPVAMSKGVTNHE